VTATDVAIESIELPDRQLSYKNSFMIEGHGSEHFSEPGDSGSLIVKASGEVVGMLFCGVGKVSYAFPIDEALLRKLDCSFIAH
jgi:hypothetical protein